MSALVKTSSINHVNYGCLVHPVTSSLTPFPFSHILLAFINCDVLHSDTGTYRHNGNGESVLTEHENAILQQVQPTDTESEQYHTFKNTLLYPSIPTVVLATAKCLTVLK